ncbi:MAG TPA: TIGR03013 family XrtA/PEP-CTERM system glycosyltransferase [Blastocatellia bacterium]|nr:TIGR03013 family XrtA/PEP-CTERM system glycosyltransferase [Blastocatellia bacterium]
MMSKNLTRPLAMLIFEGALIYLCGVVAIYIRFGDNALEALDDQRGWEKTLLVTALILASLYLFDLYDFRLIRNREVLFLRLVQALGMGGIALALIFYVWPQMILGRGVFLLAISLILTLMVGWRYLARWMLGHPRFAERVLILGAEQEAVAIAREVLTRREAGYDVVGFIGMDPAQVGRSLINPKVVGMMADLEAVVSQYRADRIVIAMSDRRGRLPLDLLLKLKVRDGIILEEAEVFYARLTGKIGGERLRLGQLIFADASRWLLFYKRARRLVDVALAIIIGLLTAPLMLITAVAIKLDSRGPVFYSQERVGLHNAIFRIVKFRSMRVDAEANGPVWANEGDTRVTRVGRWIRKLRIDELPQLFNIIRGEMSLIGPRPERPVFIEQLEQRIPYYSERHLVKPGLTGWAQVRYPYGASFEDAREKHQYDLYYIKNQSPMLDALILLETVRIVLFGRFSR